MFFNGCFYPHSQVIGPTALAIHGAANSDGEFWGGVRGLSLLGKAFMAGDN